MALCKIKSFKIVLFLIGIDIHHCVLLKRIWAELKRVDVLLFYTKTQKGSYCQALV